jgi:hypothetical protein
MSDFVRSFGVVKKRNLGGLRGWVGESTQCEAHHALKIAIKNFKDPIGNVTIPLNLAFRRFYFDGISVGKLEVGLTTGIETQIDLTRDQSGKLLHHFLSLPADVSAGLHNHNLTSTQSNGSPSKLVTVGPAIARLYSAATLLHKPNLQLENWWVLAGPPLVFLIQRSDETIRIPFKGQIIPRSADFNCELSYYEIPYPTRVANTRMWVMRLAEDQDYRSVRALKICLLRLHAEFSALRLIGRNIGSGKIEIAKNSSESELLQEYMNSATRRISRLSSQAERLSEDAVAELARESEDMINPGERDELIAFLRNIGIRKQVFYKVERELKVEINARQVYLDNSSQEVYMDSSSKYNNQNSTIGVQGDNATVGNVNQVTQSGGEMYASWSQSGGNLGSLAQDLGTLKAELKKKAETGEELDAASAIAKAEEAAKKNDGPGVFGYLKTAGKWALDTATGIGTTVAVEALKKALGM